MNDRSIWVFHVTFIIYYSGLNLHNTYKFVLNFRRNEDLDSHYTEKRNVFILMMSISNTPRKLYHE